MRQPKRHTARRITSTRYAVPVGCTLPAWYLTWMGGTPFPGLDKEVPRSQVWMEGTSFPGLDGGYPYPRFGQGGIPSQVWIGVPAP